MKTPKEFIGFITSDGKHFDNLQKARAHEGELYLLELAENVFDTHPEDMVQAWKKYWPEISEAMQAIETVKGSSE